ncbi:pseudaminic acid cytidylyltransferase [Fulvivirga sp. 29W222]|uniref:Pseudaminic acid cytidylyltransferase n=1 Tax=Fulvivirga marina TaxID=2494733 RepID=A0A937G3X7_9BACT|nr:pseudaminic acid cytidylyltransferase [Fulvivirga marina]MBL6449856.1 pseudaminic acid cytidylyltransferase [Fulvivirga marina]
MNNLAIIPARGGSKRIPRKNIRNFLNKPIISYSIQTAFESGLFSEVMVSTDDDEIAQIALDYGASVPFKRSKDNSDDFATTAEVILEVLNNYKNNNNLFSHACCIYPTAPLLKTTTLKDAYNLLVSRNFDTVFPTVKFSYPIWRALNVAPTGKASMIWPENKSKRSQDLSPAWHDAGQFYWLDTSSFFEKPELFGVNSGTIEIADLEAQDIDTFSDWQIAELKARISDE